ncbi:MAG: dephospho-CoA kinase [Cyclobacteriaceae bacterium]|nr:dephospho-CoA kinase [Cyclobacteriaceae bacterium]MCH8516880.1 dephospho-CoA kinase [Cyclobacteriaceae bacterium]
MLEIGITGGIGSGKSTVCKVFAQFGVPIYDADSRAKELMLKDSLKKRIIDLFGEEAYLADGQLNRSFIAQQAFQDEGMTKKLNNIVHPAVRLDYLDWVEEQRSQGHAYAIREAALLYESKSHQGLDGIIVVSAPEKLRIKRVLKRDAHRTEKDVKKIISRQMSEEEKKKRADYLIFNDEKLPLVPQILKLHSRFNRLYEESQETK